MFNRTILYLTRKKGKTFTLLTLIVLISTFVTTSLALMDTTNQVSRSARESIDARIEIRQLEQYMINEESIDEMLNISGLVNHNAMNTGLSSSRDIAFRQGIPSGVTDNMGTITAVDDSSLQSNFISELFSLVEGRHITHEDENVLMISSALDRENNIGIGDTLNLRPAEISTDEEGMVENALDDTTIYNQVEVIGIFAITENQMNAHTVPSAFIIANQMFTSHDTMKSLGLAEAGYYESITLFVGDPSELPSIVEQIRQLDDVNWDYFFMSHDDGDYMRISGDFRTIQNLLTVLLIAIGIVSAIILMLILILRMRGRMHEVGILLSVGINKKQILGGLLLEIIIIATFSFAISYGISSLIVPTLNQSLLASLPAISDLGEQQLRSISLTTSVVIYLMILVIILITAYISTLMTIRLKPKQILSKMS